MEQANDFKATKLFVDRVEPTETVRKYCGSVLNGESQKHIISFYGYGGIGKSRFYDELATRLSELKNINYSIIGLNSYEFNSVLSILLAIRRKINTDCPKFDYAAIQYYSKSGLPHIDLQKQYANVKSTVLSTVKTIATESADMFIPFFTYVKKAAEFSVHIKNTVTKLIERHRFSEIEKMTAHEIQIMLPVFLAESINKSEKLQVIAFDDYESMRNKLKDCSLCDSCDEWVVNLIRSIDKGIFLFSSREKLTWTNTALVQPYLHEYYLDRLTDEDSVKFLKAVPVEDAYINEIVRASQGLPLYLDMCVDIYQQYKRENVGSFDLSNVDQERLLERYLSHLPDGQRNLVRILSLLETFDRTFLSFLIKKLHFAIDELDLNELLEKCIFNKLDGCYKIDQTIRCHLASTVDDRTKFTLCNVLTDYINSPDNTENLIEFFDDLCLLIDSVADKLTKNDFCNFFKAVNYVTDRGYWVKVKEIAVACLKSERFSSLLEYITAFELKRSGRLKEALSIVTDLCAKKEEFGDYRYNIDLLEAQLIHLLGDYKKASELYNKIIEELEIFDLEDTDARTSILCRLKSADIKMLKGEFLSAKKVLKDIPTTNDVALGTEYRRIKAHIYKFNFDYDFANRLYLNALEKCENDLKSKGQLLCNLAEINCVKFPDKAINYADEANRINEAINAPIETGKTYAALSIAYLKKKDFEKAEKYFTDAYELQKNSGYKSGILFALFANAVYQYAKGNEREYLSVVDKMRALTEETGVYKYLTEYAEAFGGKDLCDGEWLDKQKTLAGLNELVELN